MCGASIACKKKKEDGGKKKYVVSASQLHPVESKGWLTVKTVGKNLAR